MSLKKGKNICTSNNTTLWLEKGRDDTGKYQYYIKSCGL
jgi:hypothetical protein